MKKFTNYGKANLMVYSFEIENNYLLDLKYAYKTHFLTNIFIFVQVRGEGIKIKPLYEP